MKKAHILVPLLVGILMVSAFAVPTVKAATIEELQAQIQQLLQIIKQLQMQISHVGQPQWEIPRPTIPRPPVPTTVINPQGNCGWCGASCIRLQRWMYCPQVVPPAGYECKDINGVCKKVLSPTPVTTKPAPTSTCHDSDGGKNYYVKGYIYKAAQWPKIGMTNRFYDTCIDSHTLKEYYCDSNDDIKSINYTCSEGCWGGKCRLPVPTTVINPQGNCGWCGASCTRIKPWMYCPQITPPAGYECKDINGVCKKVLSPTPVTTKPAPTSTCHDSDGGKNYYVKGTVTWTNYVWHGIGIKHDTCVDSHTLKEYYCDGNDDIKSINYTCPNGCQNGACVRIPVGPIPTNSSLMLNTIQTKLAQIQDEITKLMASMVNLNHPQ